MADRVSGIFLAGTCGEGPWLPNRERRRLVQAAVAFARGRLQIAVQVSDNSVERILDNILDVAAAGANIAIIAPPATMLNFTPRRIVELYARAADRSALPVGVYDLGTQRTFAIPSAQLEEVYLLPNVALVKDSSGDPRRRELALGARRKKPVLQLFNGDEFKCLEYLQAGYDGAMFGGAVAAAPFVHRIVALHEGGDPAGAAEVERQMKRVLYGIYGGETIPCWLTGLKYYLYRRRVFGTYANFLGYPLNDSCRAFIDRFVDSGQFE